MAAHSRNNILYRCPLRRGNDPHRAGKPGGLSFSLRRQQALQIQLLPQGGIIGAAAALPHRLDIIGGKLILSVPLVKGHGAPDDHQAALLRKSGKMLRVPGKHHAAQGGALITDGKVVMPRLAAVAHRGQLSPDQQITQQLIFLQLRLNISVQLRNPYDLRRHPVISFLIRSRPQKGARNSPTRRRSPFYSTASSGDASPSE